MAGHITVATLKAKFKNIQTHLKIPMTFLAAIEKDDNRKPAVGMWEYFGKI